MQALMSTEDWLAQQRATPAHCRLDDEAAGIDRLGVLEITGPDAGKFLQGQLTCDVLGLEVGQQTLGACCTPQGRMRALFRLIRREQGFCLLMPRAVVPLLLEALKKYAVFFKAQLRDASSEFQIHGLLATALTAAPAGSTLVDLPGELPRQLLLSASGETVALPGEACAPRRWFAAELWLGEPAVYPETVEKLLPHHVNLPALGGVSFTKGCYTGQEIVARMEYRGKIKTHLQRASASFPTPAAPGCPVRAGDRDVGEVVRSCTSEQGQLLLVTLSDPAISASLQLGLPEAPILELHH